MFDKKQFLLLKDYSYKQFNQLIGRSVGYKYSKHIIAGVIGLLLCGAVAGGYYLYRYTQNAKAQELFCDSAQAYDIALRKFLSGKDKTAAKEEMVDLGMELDGTYNQINDSELASYTRALQANVAILQGDLDGGIDLLETAVEKTQQGSLLSYLYKTKLALLYLDQKEKDVVQKGLSLLENLAHDKENTCRDMALYYLGLYYRSEEKTEKASSEWKELVEQFAFKDKPKKSSPWAKMAENQLNQMDS